MRCLSTRTPSTAPGSIRSPVPLQNRPEHRRAAVVNAAGDRRPQGQEANGVLDAFFLGKAIAETVNEKVGAALGEILSEITKANAERDYAWRSFQQEVQQRADREKELRTGISLGAFPTSTTAETAQIGQARTAVSQSTTTSSNSSTSGWRSESQALRDSSPPSVAADSEPTDMDLQELADDLRAEIAQARASLKQLNSYDDKPSSLQPKLPPAP